MRERESEASKGGSNVNVTGNVLVRWKLPKLDVLAAQVRLPVHVVRDVFETELASHGIKVTS